MFSSSGLFSDINCPFARRELCERPHCLYKHASTQSSIMDFTGVQKGNVYAAAGAPGDDDTKDYCLHELERINKEIETVRHEVEQEQRRLSRYQTIQADSRNNAPVSKCVTTGQHLDRSSYGLPSFTDFDKTHARPRKYVVDNSKPRTDLEYDPLSNFSADLRSYNSSGKEQKMKHSQDLKRARNDCDQKDPASHQAKFSRSPSPEPLDDSNEDGVLIIDVPPSPDKTRGQALLDSLQLHTTNAETFKVASPSATRVDTSEVYCGVESNRDLPTFNEYKECKNVALDGSVFDLTECLEDLRSECQKLSTGFQSTETVMENISEPVSLPATSEQRDPSLSDPRCELTSGDEKMNPQQPPKSSLFHKAPAANSPRRQHTRQDEPTHNRAHWPLQQPATSSVPGSQKMSSKKPEEVQGEAAIDRTSPVRYQQRAEPASSSSHSQPCHVSSTSVNTHLTARVESLSELAEQLLEMAENEEVIIISSDDELSDSDTMEECYRIFMEANNEEKGNEDYPDVSIEATDVAEKKVNVTPEALAGKKRVAHEAKLTEEPVAKIRPQPQVLVPLRGPAASGFGSRPPTTSKIQQVQQRASMMSAAVKGGQAFVSSNCEKIPESHNSPSALTPTSENLHAAPAQNACLNYISLGTAVIEVGNNLHLILPDGAFPLPVTSTSSPVTSVLTPISQAHTSAFKQTYHPPAVTLVQKCRPTAPVLIPAPARKPSPTSALTSSTSSPAAFMAPPAPVQAAPKSVPAKRKVKQQCDAPKDKVPHDIRQRYINMFTEEFLKTSANVNDAFEKALVEEKTVYNRSMNKLKYLSVAVNALKRLKNQSAVAAKEQNEVESQRFKGNISFNPKKFKGNDDMVLYESLKDYILTDERLIESNYPLQHPEKRSCAALFADNKKVNTDPLKRICCRCGATYSVSQSGKHIRKEECNYHYGKGVEKRVPGGVETRYSCCEGVMGAPGCQVFQLHVHDALSLDGFVSTVPRRPSDTSCPGVYSLDCEMCYTIHGLELSRVTVVNSSLQVVYDTYVRPDNEVIDYITRFSGISEEDVKGNHTSLREVQETLLSFISSDTILVGHGLETDLCLLKLLHGKVVDTSVVFPHRLGPPHKLTLNNLTAEYLRRIIQESVCGHDTAEDAAACMELLLWKGKEDGKLKK